MRTLVFWLGLAFFTYLGAPNVPPHMWHLTRWQDWVFAPVRGAGLFVRTLIVELFAQFQVRPPEIRETTIMILGVVFVGLLFYYLVKKANKPPPKKEEKKDH